MIWPDFVDFAISVPPICSFCRLQFYFVIICLFAGTVSWAWPVTMRRQSVRLLREPHGNSINTTEVLETTADLYVDATITHTTTTPLLLCSLPSGFSVVSGQKRERKRVGGGDRCAIFFMGSNWMILLFEERRDGPVAVLGPPILMTTLRPLFSHSNSCSPTLSFLLPLAPIPLPPRAALRVVDNFLPKVCEMGCWACPAR